MIALAFRRTSGVACSRRSRRAAAATTTSCSASTKRSSARRSPSPAAAAGVAVPGQPGHGARRPRDLGGARRGRGSSANTPRCPSASAGGAARCGPPGAWTSSCTPAARGRGDRRAAVHDLERQRGGRPRPRPHALFLWPVPEAALHGRGPGALPRHRILDARAVARAPARVRVAGAGGAAPRPRLAPAPPASGRSRTRTLVVAPLAGFDAPSTTRCGSARARPTRCACARDARLPRLEVRALPASPDTTIVEATPRRRPGRLRGEPPRGATAACAWAGSWTASPPRDDDAARDALLGRRPRRASARAGVARAQAFA